MTQTHRELVEAIRSCTLCAANLPLPPKPILQLHPDAKILIAGQAPGRKTHEKGIPFDDASGDRLRQWLGVDRATFYDARKFAIVPMGFCFPGTGKSGDLPPRPECAATWHTQIWETLPKLQLSLVIGQYALDYHFDDRMPVTERVRQWKTLATDKMPLPHPSPRNNRWLRNNPWFEQELLPDLRRQIASLLASD